MASMTFGRDAALGVASSAAEAVARLHREHYRSLVRLAALLLDDLGASEEVVQDAFVRVQLGWGRLAEGLGAAPGWPPGPAKQARASGGTGTRRWSIKDHSRL